MNRIKRNVSSSVTCLGERQFVTVQPVLHHYLISWLVCVTLALGTAMNTQAYAGATDPAGGASLFNQSCPSGEFVQGIDSSGKLLCAAVGLPTPPSSANNCTVTLESFGSNKIVVLKTVRAITGLGLKEAKNLVEAAPSIIKQGISKLESDDNSKQLQQTGAIVSTACAEGTQ